MFLECVYMRIYLYLSCMIFSAYCESKDFCFSLILENPPHFLRILLFFPFLVFFFWAPFRCSSCVFFTPLSVPPSGSSFITHFRSINIRVCLVYWAFMSMTIFTIFKISDWFRSLATWSCFISVHFCSEISHSYGYFFIS